MKLVKSSYARKPMTKRPVKASEDIELDEVKVEEDLQPTDVLLTVDDAAELIETVASDIKGEEVKVETELAEDAESVDFIVDGNVYTAVPEEDADIVVSAKLLKGRAVRASHNASRRPARRPVSASRRPVQRPAQRPARRPVSASANAARRANADVSNRPVKASREELARRRRIAAARNARRTHR